MENSIKLFNDEILINGYIEKGKGLFNDGEIEKAFKNFNKAIFVNNEYALTYFVKAQAYTEIYEVEEAEKCLNIYLKLVPGDPKAYLKLLDIHDLTGDFDKCIYYCEKLLENDMQNPTIHMKKAEFLVLLNSLEEAINCFDKCLELEPNFYDAICGKANAMLLLRYKKEALELYNKAIEVDITKGDAYFGISQVYMSMGPITKAFTYAEKAYNIEPENEWYKCHYNVLKNMNLKI